MLRRVLSLLCFCFVFIGFGLQESVLQSDYDEKRTDLETEVWSCVPTNSLRIGETRPCQQKLQKVEVGLQEEQKVSDPLKKRYAAAMAEKRRCYSLSRLFSGGRLGLATTRVRVLVLRIATKYNSEFSLSGLHFGRMLTTSYAY
ncbi:hypothetical protein Peur_030411 [Populus x canadensis]